MVSWVMSVPEKLRGPPPKLTRIGPYSASMRQTVQSRTSNYCRASASEVNNPQWNTLPNSMQEFQAVTELFPCSCACTVSEPRYHHHSYIDIAHGNVATKLRRKPHNCSILITLYKMQYYLFGGINKPPRKTTWKRTISSPFRDLFTCEQTNTGRCHIH